MRSNDEIISILKVAMDEKNLSLSELARRAGVAKSAVSRYLNLTREFPLNRAEDFAKALGISTEYLLGFNKSE
ncbi:helix-turn-helix transcriptional regulator, partial [Staphylococcus pseudintermedius]|nr:helix-turn-helix transcriptional regulator [Staphylococcus pseudintermedius]MDF0044530.1 helix-turn-helix transcriptional regulator [Staphylococcus pseudintermedius]MDF0047985.1 helix-turn-helix transcriptional regulator [Staphylococcus pseudintermedius]